MFKIIRSFGMRHPGVRVALSPAWRHVTDFLWALRSGVFGGWPITFAVGSHRVSMVTKGQIVEYVWRGAFEVCERDFAASEMKPGMRVLNIGANAGLYTIIASKMVGPEGKVHAFEPATQNFSLLKKNIELNECQNVVANNVALSNFSGRISLNCDPLHPEFDGHFYVRSLEEPLVNSSAPLEIVPCTTLDEYWRDFCGEDIKPVDFIVIDVEGAELSVFQGARHMIGASRNLVMIMESTENIPEIAEFLGEFGFSYYQLNADSCCLVPAELGRGSFVAMRKEPGIHSPRSL